MSRFDEAAKGAFAISLGAWIFGTGGVFIKYLDLSPMVLSGLRLLAPAFILVAVLPQVRQQVLRKHDPRLFLASCITTLRILLWVTGLLWAPISKAVIVLFSWPLIFTVLSFVRGHEPVSLAKLSLVVTGFLGIVLLKGDAGFDWQSRESLGLLCMLGAAVLFSLNLFIFKSAVEQSSPMEVVCRDSLVGALVFLPFVIVGLPSMTWLQLGVGVGYGALIGIAGYGLVFWGLARVKASSAAVLAYGEVLSACFCGVLLFSESMSPLAWLGAALVLLSSVLVKRCR